MDWLTFVIFCMTCFVAGSTGSLFPTGDWYKSLNKPLWNPPDWLFPIAWTILYVMVAFVGMRISIVANGNTYAVALWGLQISFNIIWTPVFFGLHRIRLAMGFMLGLWSTVLAMVVSYWYIDLLASALLVPYFLWVSFAAFLNYRIMTLN